MTQELPSKTLIGFVFAVSASCLGAGTVAFKDAITAQAPETIPTENVAEYTETCFSREVGLTLLSAEAATIDLSRVDAENVRDCMQELNLAAHKNDVTSNYIVGGAATALGGVMLGIGAIGVQQRREMLTPVAA